MNVGYVAPLTGIMSAAELHSLRGRMNEGRLNKARRGQLFNHAPIGYLRVPDGLILDPDEQVQGVVRLIFDQFERQGSIHGLLRYLVKHGIRLPVRPHGGPNRGQLEWHRPNRETLQHLLHHPVYAGYYRHGYRAIDPRRQIPGRPVPGRTIHRPEDCPVLLEGRCPAYITPERFRANQARLEANRARQESAGAVRSGPALLGGLLVCGRCGQRMMVAYSGQGSRLRYSCGRAAIEYAAPQCQGLAGRALDDLVAAQVLTALEPAALELSLAAADDLEQERARLHGVRQQELERARYEAERARRQYDAVEPENRLVARELERRWEETLKGQRRLEEDARFCRSQPMRLSAAERTQIGSLAQDLPALWQAAGTTSADRQRVVRLLVEEVVATVQGQSERVDVQIRWAGGLMTQHEIMRPVQCYEQLAEYGRLRKRIDELRESGLTLAAVAERLNQQGFRPPKRSQTFNKSIVGQLLWGRGSARRHAPAGAANSLLGEHEWLLSDLAGKLGMSAITLHRWVRVGWVHARKLATPRGHWAIWADGDELERMTRLRNCPRGWSEEPILAKLTKPKSRDNN
jgi:hypothetical protein